MQTVKLIESLAAGLEPVRARSTTAMLAPGLLAGAAAVLVVVVAVYGVQPDLDTFDHGAPFAMKVAYGGMIGAMALALAAGLARPGQSPAVGRWMWAPFATLALLAAWQLALAPSATWPSLMLGGSWTRCPWRILALSMPVFAGLAVLVRRQAPTDLRRAGAAMGLTAGATAASLYALACTESSAAFVLVWYTLGMALSAALGAIVGPRVLRW